jgi:dTDP-4-amino-4,6-dideoxygalactose transaminase
MNKNYTSWPLGEVPQKFQRPELSVVRSLGYEWQDPRDIIDIFEKKVAEFAGSKYAVATDCASHGIFLSLKYLNSPQQITIPKRTYASIPMQILHAGYQLAFEDREWSGIYQLKPLAVWDGAVRWQKNMYAGGFHILSFQLKKRVPIGRGGMILLDDPTAYQWLKRATYDGRDLSVNQWDDEYMLGWHYYMTPEDAARGIIIMDQIAEHNPDSATHENYPDLSQKKIFQRNI